MDTIKQIKLVEEKVVHMNDFDSLVQEVYKRPYRLQQQNGCVSRGIISFKAPLAIWYDTYEDMVQECDYSCNEIPEVINGEAKGVSFEAWLNRDPEKPVNGESDNFSMELFWHRNFYPSLDMVVYDLHKRGHLPAGEYLVIIDW